MKDLFPASQDNITPQGDDYLRGKLEMHLKALVSRLPKVGEVMASSGIEVVNLEESQPEEGSLEAAFLEAVQEQSFDLRGKLGRLWTKEKSTNKDIEKKYASISGYEAQRAFRIQWATTKYNQLKSERIRSATTSSTDLDDGVYVIFDTLMKDKYSGNTLAATNYAMSCLEKFQNKQAANGRPWVRYNDMNKFVEFLFFEKKIRNAFTEEWTKRTVEEKTSETGEAGASDKPPEKKVKTAAKPKPKPSPGKKPDGTDDGENGEGKALDSLIKKARAVKLLMVSAVGSYSDLMRTMETDSEWTRYNNAVMKEFVNKAHTELMQLRDSSPFWKDWANMEDFGKHVKKTYQFNQALAEFTNLEPMQRLIENLTHEVKMLRGMKRDTKKGKAS